MGSHRQDQPGSDCHWRSAPPAAATRQKAGVGRETSPDDRIEFLAIAASDPIQPVGFLLSSHSAKGRFYELERHKAAAGSLALPARSGQCACHIASITPLTRTMETTAFPAEAQLAPIKSSISVSAKNIRG